MNTIQKRLLVGLLALLLLTSSALAADLNAAEAAAALAEAQREQAGLAADAPLLSSGRLEPGSSVGDWYAIALARAGIADDNAAYLTGLQEYVERQYRENGGLDHIKATEWHRISLAVLALGGDPRAFGTRADGSAIDLIADGTYAWQGENELGAQGINAWIFALISLDAGGYAVPEGDVRYTREDILLQVLQAQLPDGGWALSPGGPSDPDLTAMALQALATCQGDAAVYVYTTRTGVQTETTVSQAIDRGLQCLSGLQQENGGFSSWGTENSESISQVILALCSLGRDPDQEPLLVKDGGSPVDALLRFRLEDGSFSHDTSMTPNAMASEQALLALAALDRLETGRNTVYDMTDVAERQTQEEPETAGGISQETMQPGFAGPAVAAGTVAAAVVVICVVRRKASK